MLALASTDVEKGSRVLTASFSWDRGNLPDTLDFHRITHGDPTLVAAVHNSARFPYVSPAGRLRTTDGRAGDHLVDGGYFDPSSVETLADLATLLTPLASAKGLTVVPIYVTNSFPGSVYGGQLRTAEILGEVFAPVRALVRSRDAHARTAEGRMASELVTLGFCQPSAGGRGTAMRLEPPLGWELSMKTQERIDSFWDACGTSAAVRQVLGSVGGQWKGK
jgi:hypothetical protein